MKRRNPNRFLISSFVALIVLTIVVFGALAHYMDLQSSKTIGQVGRTYMQSLSEQICLHFQTLIDLRLEQVNSMVSDVRPAAQHPDISRAQVMEELSEISRTRGFSQLGLLGDDGQFEMIYGDKISLEDPDPFIASMSSGNSKAAVGTDTTGNRLVLMGVPCQYKMGNGEPALALVATVLKYIHLSYARTAAL